MTIDPHLAVRGGALYGVALLLGFVWWRRAPSRRLAEAALIASLWNVPALLLLHVAAMRFGWWAFDAAGGLLIGLPVDLYLAWACLWGALPAIALPRSPLWIVGAAAIAVDLALMPLCAPVVQLGSRWLIGEAAGVAIALMPAQLLARWTLEDRRLAARASLQVSAFAGLLLFVVPAMALDASGGSWHSAFERPAWYLNLTVHVLALPALLGLSAVQEFVTRGAGTPVPFDPPRRLVTSGMYRYVRNPMQLSGAVVLLMLAVILASPWIALGAGVAFVYSAGIAGWDEDEDLRRRFGPSWTAYRRSVPAWLPRMRPYHRANEPPARLYVSEGCGMCRDVARWFARRDARHLLVIPAEEHPSRALRRLTYEAADGAYRASGIEALARGFEHIHLGWALVGSTIRLPGIRPLVQLFADASGAGPRTIGRAPARSAENRASAIHRPS